MQPTVLITGASRGIGRAAAQLLAQNGWQVAINYHQNTPAAQSLLAELTASGARAAIFQADVADRQQVEAMFAAVRAQLGPIQALVNNAGIAQQKLFTDITDAEWQRMFAVTVDGAFHCTQAALQDMLPAKQGAIVNISSMWGQAGASCEVHYSAAKAALIGLTKALAKELGPSHIRVNCIAPGVIATEMNAALDGETLAQLAEDTPLGTIGQPEDVAQMILYLLQENTGRFLTGQIIGVNGGFII